MSDPSTLLPFNPITIVRQDDENVTFTITNPFGENVVALYYQFAAANTGDTKCYSEAPFSFCPEPIEVTAHCLTAPKYSLSIVDIWFVDPAVVDNIDNSTVPECCEPDPDQEPIPTVQYSFKIYCESKCVEVIPGGRQRILTGDGKRASKSASEFEFLARDEGILVDRKQNEDLNKNTEKDNDGKSHFCSALDYPCGESDKMVHVCHYSSKEGYQTFCVPESDSDVIAYVPKDYCGPCVGGYGGGSNTYRN